MTAYDPTAPWCHHCDLPLDEAHTLRTPVYLIGDKPTVELVCSRCLRGPEDAEERRKAA